MAGLLYKEFILNRKNLFIHIIGVLFLSLWLFIPASSVFDNGAEAVYTLLMMAVCFIIFLLSGSLQQNIFVSDERKKWADYITSTPLTDKGQVLSKYYFSVLISIASLFYCTIVYGINAVIQGKDSGALSIAIVLFIIQFYLRSFEFPFIIRFGSKAGNNYRIAIIGLLTCIVFVYALFGDLSIFGTFEGFMDWFTKLIMGDAFSDILLVLVATVPIIAGILYYLSYKVSCRLYLKGAETYDK